MPVNQVAAAVTAYRRAEPLWHVCDQILSAGASIGPHAIDSPHWRRAQADPRMAPVEDALERCRPNGAVTRRLAVYATDSPALVRALLGERKQAHLHRVEVPENADCSGRYNMGWVAPFTTAGDAAARASSYWAGAGSPTRWWEVLAAELRVVALAPAAFVAAVRNISTWVDLTYPELLAGRIIDRE